MIQRRHKERPEWKREAYKPPPPIERRPLASEEASAPRLDDLRGIIRDFIRQFPYQAKDNLESKVNVWSGGLKEFPFDRVRKAMQFFILNYSGDCPALADIRGMILEYEQEALPKPRTFPLPDHDCQSPERQESTALSTLAAVDPYTASHVCCECPGTPVCPQCGAVGEASVNRVVFHLMERYPHETQDWKPERKGYALCEQCRDCTNLKG